MKVFDLLDVVNKICPFEDAFDDDKVGLLIGSGANDVSGIVVSHDLEKSTLDYCKENNINTVISYHPATYKKYDDLNEKCTPYKKPGIAFEKYGDSSVGKIWIISSSMKTTV